MPARLEFGGGGHGRRARGVGEAKRRPGGKVSGEWRLGFGAGRLTLYTWRRSGSRALVGFPCSDRPTCFVGPTLNRSMPGRRTCRGVGPSRTRGLCRAVPGPINSVPG
jgi:hypothetical protein